jgi:probable rRNA maturation factor
MTEKSPETMHENGMLDSRVEVEISDTQGLSPIDADRLRALVQETLASEGVRSGSVSVAIVGDAAIREVNRRHLGHDWETDVVSFRLSEPEEPDLSAEIVVSAEMALKTAREAGIEPAAELALYVVHGLLHVCGYDDHSAADIATMRRREDEILTAAGWPNTFQKLGAISSQERECVRWPS